MSLSSMISRKRQIPFGVSPEESKHYVLQKKEALWEISKIMRPFEVEQTKSQSRYPLSRGFRF
jgi:hypothetical protein